MKKVLISSCLIGENVRYDGLNNDIRHHFFIKYLYNHNLLIPLCPEVLGGLLTPRVPMEISFGKVISKEGKDTTKEFYLGADIAYDIAYKENVKMAILKSRSPSCGVDNIYDGSFTGSIIKGDGITAGLLKKRNILVFSEDNLEKAQEFWNTL